MTTFVDTTIQVERVFADAKRRARLQTLLGAEENVVACSFSRLEFKRVVIQNLALTLDYLIDEKSFWGAMNRACRLRSDRRVKMLVRILSWTGEQVEGRFQVQKGEGIDRKLTLQSESYIRNAIEYLWHWFDAQVLTVVDKTECQRAREAPRKTRTGKWDLAIHERKCATQKCRNALFIRERLPQIRKLCRELETLESSGRSITSELQIALATLQAVIKASAFYKLYDYKQCLAVGDVWIHLECAAAEIEDFVTTNYKESETLCPLLGLKMVTPEKP